ncbi:hypothetical protein L226DRAFT_326908 [Lentinus tigrinus ALCF2SS1-7]|uniref:Uncharacterized protein n=1 Tax=Lentinus tigrinus ALCF2SS1-6 TaxID=1328759 RepID=A0A5C2SHA9_9APHY|nr:hypothetical protein L227DRAFT_431896 [Lentinus tigrinus ALCF2SS1-6]RPD77605.1 hypothetical protein L226DRAFT_326908 [Lentinus tigrinus ALCF2SS1-7]
MNAQERCAFQHQSQRQRGGSLSTRDPTSVPSVRQCTVHIAAALAKPRGEASHTASARFSPSHTAPHTQRLGVPRLLHASDARPHAAESLPTPTSSPRGSSNRPASRTYTHDATRGRAVSCLFVNFACSACFAEFAGDDPAPEVRDGRTERCHDAERFPPCFCCPPAAHNIQQYLVPAPYRRLIRRRKCADILNVMGSSSSRTLRLVPAPAGPAGKIC